MSISYNVKTHLHILSPRERLRLVASRVEEMPEKTNKLKNLCFFSKTAHFTSVSLLLHYRATVITNIAFTNAHCGSPIYHLLCNLPMLAVWFSFRFLQLLSSLIVNRMHVVKATIPPSPSDACPFHCHVYTALSFPYRWWEMCSLPLRCNKINSTSNGWVVRACSLNWEICSV